jgi:hypothetical protein
LILIYTYPNKLQRGGDAENLNITCSDTLADEVQVDLHMLRALMLHRIGGEVDGADVVAVDEGGALEWAVELVEELAQPGGLRHAVGYGAVFSLCAGAGDDGLPLGSPGDVGDKRLSGGEPRGRCLGKRVGKGRPERTHVHVG